MASPTSPPAKIQAKNVSKVYGETPVLNGVNFAVAPGEIRALLGGNGAGKSTFMKILSGAEKCSSGEIFLDESPFTPDSPLAARQRGVTMIYQELSLVNSLSVADNIVLGVEPAKYGVLKTQAKRDLATTALSLLGRSDLPLTKNVGLLSASERQIVEIARALAFGSEVLILDEPTSSLGKEDTEKLFQTLRALSGKGYAIIYISHFVSEVLQIANSYTILQDGSVTHEGDIADETSESLTTLLTFDASSPSLARPSQKSSTLSQASEAEVLVAREVRSHPLPRKASLTLKPGEIRGIAGLVGSGKSEFLRTLFRALPLDAGTYLVHGAPAPETVQQCWRAGIGFLSEDRSRDGLLLERSILENIMLPPKFECRGTKASRFLRASVRSEETKVCQWIERLNIKCFGPHQRVRELSGGNQQKVALAKLLESGSSILLLDEPTRGIDLKAKRDISFLLKSLVDGAGERSPAVILVSESLEELLELSDQIQVMREGHLHDSIVSGALTEQTLFSQMLGASSQ